MILAVFAAVAVIGQAINVALALVVDQMFSPTVGALFFVLTYMLVFAAAWLISLRIVEGRAAPQIPALPRRSEPHNVAHAGHFPAH